MKSLKERNTVRSYENICLVIINSDLKGQGCYSF